MPLTSSRPTALVAVIVGVLTLLLVAACSGSDDPTATATPAPTEVSSPTASASPTAAPPTTEAGSNPPATASPPPAADRTEDPAPNVANTLAHVTRLASDIGIRAAGTEAEREAAAYIADVLEEAGYDAAIESFPISTRQDGSRIEVDGSALDLRPLMMNGSATGEATGPLVFGGLGSPEELAPLDVEGRVLLLDRGILPFGEKARNAELAGAGAVLVVNNEAGPFNGNLGDRPATIPVLAVARDDGDLLRQLADDGATVTVRTSIDNVTIDSQNVVGRSGDTCRFLIGAHYDSVPAGPGANDNASGTALMLELARLNRVDGLCVIAFGAEEIGLFGSQAYVAEHGVEDALFMLNFDMAGRLDDALVIGDGSLTGLLLPAIEEFPIRAGQFPPFASSDHVPFLDVGVPAVTITSGNDPLIHSAGDDIDNVSPEALATMLEIGERALSTALAAAG